MTRAPMIVDDPSSLPWWRKLTSSSAEPAFDTPVIVRHETEPVEITEVIERPTDSTTARCLRTCSRRKRR